MAYKQRQLCFFTSGTVGSLTIRVFCMHFASSIMRGAEAAVRTSDAGPVKVPERNAVCIPRADSPNYEFMKVVRD